MVLAEQDIIPRYGLSIYKPGALWPPPPDELVRGVREELTSTFRATLSRHTGTNLDAASPAESSNYHDAPDGTPSSETEPKTVLGDTNLGPSAIAHAHAEEKTNPSPPSPESKERMWKFGDAQAPRLGVDYMPMPTSTQRGEPIRGVIDGKHIEMQSQIQLCAMSVSVPSSFLLLAKRELIVRR